jgi:hypothetical protein
MTSPHQQNTTHQQTDTSTQILNRHININFSTDWGYWSWDRLTSICVDVNDHITLVVMMWWWCDDDVMKTVLFKNYVWWWQCRVVIIVTVWEMIMCWCDDGFNDRDSQNSNEPSRSCFFVIVLVPPQKQWKIEQVEQHASNVVRPFTNLPF